MRDGRRVLLAAAIALLIGLLLRPGDSHADEGRRRSLRIRDVVVDPQAFDPSPPGARLAFRAEILIDDRLLRARGDFVLETEWKIRSQSGARILTLLRRDTVQAPSRSHDSDKDDESGRSHPTLVVSATDWDGRNAGGQTVSAGTYQVRVQSKLLRLGRPWRKGSDRSDDDDRERVLAESESETEKFRIINNQPPSIAISGVSQGDCATQFVPGFSATDSDLLSVTGTLDGQPFPSGTLVDSEGTHALLVTALDRAGNQAEVRIDFIIDRTPPVPILSMTDSAFTADTLVVNAHCDDRNVASERLHIDGVESADGTLLVQEGTRHITYRCADCAGNAAELVRTVFVDRTPPSLTVEATPALTASSVLRVAGSATDGSGSPIVMANNAIAESSSDGRFQLDLNLFEGPNQIRVTATDRAGLQAVVHVEVALDATAPRIVLEPGAEEVVRTSETILRGRVSDAHGIASLVVNGENVAPAPDGSFETSVRVPDGLSEGILEIAVAAADELGNQGSASQTRQVFISAPAAKSSELGGIVQFPTGSLPPGTVVEALVDVEQAQFEALLGQTLSDPGAMDPLEFRPGIFYMPGGLAVSMTIDAEVGLGAVQAPVLKIPNITRADNSLPLWIFEILPDLDGDGHNELALAARARVAEDGMIEAVPREGPHDPLPGLFAPHHPSLRPEDLQGASAALRAKLFGQRSRSSATEGVSQAQTVVRMYCCTASASTPGETRTRSETQDDAKERCQLEKVHLQFLVEEEAKLRAAKAARAQAADKFGGVDDGIFDLGNCVADVATLTPGIGTLKSFLFSGTQLLHEAFVAETTDQLQQAALSEDAASIALDGIELWAKAYRQTALRPVGEAIARGFFDQQLIDIGAEGIENIGRRAINERIAAQLEARLLVKQALNARKLARALPKVAKFFGTVVGVLDALKTCRKAVGEGQAFFDSWVDVAFLESSVASLKQEHAERAAQCAAAKDVRNPTPAPPAAVATVQGPRASNPLGSADSVILSVVIPSLKELDSLAVALLNDTERLVRFLDPDIGDSLSLEQATAISSRALASMNRITELGWQELDEDPLQAKSDAIEQAIRDREEIATLDEEIARREAALAEPIPASSPQAGVLTKVSSGLGNLVGVSDDEGRSIVPIHRTATRTSVSQPWIFPARSFSDNSVVLGPTSTYAAAGGFTAPELIFRGSNMEVVLDLVVDGGTRTLRSQGMAPLRWISPTNGAVLLAGQRVTAELTAVDGVFSRIEISANGRPVATITHTPFQFTWDVPTDRDEAVLLAVGTLADNSSFSASVTVRIEPDGQSPSVTLLEPVGTEVIEGAFLRVAADITDNARVSSVQFLVAGGLQMTRTSPPFAAEVRIPRGRSQVVLRVVALDPSGNEGSTEKTLAISPDPLTTVVGTVVKPNGAAAAGARVTAFGVRTPLESQDGQTDQNGQFTIPGVYTATGDVQVRATLAGSRGVSPPVSPSPGGETDAGTIRARPNQLARAYATSRGPWSVAIGEFNGDGASDLVTANREASTVSVLLGNGNGTFGERTDFDVGITPQSVAIADLNGDGASDLVTANQFASRVSVLLGNGDGTFAGKTDFVVGFRPGFVAIADLNGDGASDLVTANRDANTVSVLLGNGNGAFGAKTDFGVGSLPQSVAIADLNGDGANDLVTANQSANTVSVLLGNGNGTFGGKTDFAVGAGPQSVAIADLNGDAASDLVTANQNATTVSVLLGNGSGTFAGKTDFAVGASPYSVATADLNGDGTRDLVAANRQASTVSVLLGNGNGTFGGKTDFAVGYLPQTVAIADLNGDGTSDLVTADNGVYTVSILPGNGDGTFGGKLDFEVGVNPYSVAAADLNRDGANDLVTANVNASTVSVLLGNGDGTFGGKTDFVTGLSPRSVAIADLNGDGASDLVTSNVRFSTVSVLLGNGNGTFGGKTDFVVGDSPSSVVIADLNGDGASDLITANGRGSSTVSVLLGNGDGTFRAKTDVAVGNLNSVAIADLNGDGANDLVTTNVDNTAAQRHTVSILLGNGNGTFGGRADFEVAPTPSSVAIADLNGDGARDVVTANIHNSGFPQFMTVSVLLGNGDGTFGGKTDFAVGEQPYSVAIADLNRDGTRDLVTANWGANTVSVLLGRGDGTFGGRTDFVVGAVDTRPRSVAIADFNGDGASDLVTANEFASTVSVLLADGVQPLLGPLTLQAPHATTVHAFEAPSLPLVSHVYPAYPNPAAGGTCVRFDLAAEAHVNLAAYDVNGRRIRLLVNELRPPGRHELKWNGADEGGKPLSSGVYFLRLEAGALRRTMRVLLLR